MTAKKPSLTREEIEKAFEHCDSTSSGFIAIKRLKIVLRSMGFEPRQSEVNQLIKKMQENGVARSVSSGWFIS
jgi:centrin-2/centrin-1